MSQTQNDIAQVCEELEELLLEKNRKYGDSALNPVRIFSKANTLEQLKVRIDDKLSRLRNAADDEDEDPTTDLIGYLILYKVALMQQRRAIDFEDP
jgi:hypothetical protein